MGSNEEFKGPKRNLNQGTKGQIKIFQCSRPDWILQVLDLPRPSNQSKYDSKAKIKTENLGRNPNF